MRKHRGNILYIVIVAVLIIAIAINFIQLPYFITKPGTADKLQPMVKVSNGYGENGTLRLVTIYESHANVYQYLATKFDFNPYTQLLKDAQISFPDETAQELHVRQLNYMSTAQSTATYVAYKAADKHPKLEHVGVLVLNVHSGMPVAKALKPKDVIIGADGKTVNTIKDLEGILKGIKKGDTIRLKIMRDGKEKQVQTTAAPLPKDWMAPKEKEHAGLGILQSADVKLDVQPKVTFKTEGIGGPSAGLMMTLEIYEQLTPEDLTKGYDVCGTGTIAIDGKVGPIGGIKQKIVAADKAGAAIFFAPAADHEAQDAMAAAKDIGSDLKIVPVSTFDDALHYLQNLKPKS